VIERKNGLLSSSQPRATATESLYGLIETANGKEPHRYLSWLFGKLPETDEKDLETLIQWNMPG